MIKHYIIIVLCTFYGIYNAHSQSFLNIKETIDFEEEEVISVFEHPAVNSLIDHFSTKKYRNRRNKLRDIFYRVKRKSLSQYEYQSDFNTTFTNTGYNCVTGSLLLAYILENLDFDYTIREFNFHMLLIVDIDGTKVMLESTDPNGFISNKKEIQKRIVYHKNQPDNGNIIDNLISINEGLGVYYFNQSLESIRNAQMSEARRFANLAIKFHPSPRNLALRETMKQPYRLLLTTLAD